MEPLVGNIHRNLPLPSGGKDDACDGRVATVTGNYLYYHYGCDGIDDRGWGCGYRTLQTLCSWVRLKKQQDNSGNNVRKHEPTLKEIQETLVAVGDKPASLIGSKEWIGCCEACICLDVLYKLPCRIVHISAGSSLLAEAIPVLLKHFDEVGSPVMMGGDSDSASKGIMGVYIGKQQTYLLVMDPHYYGVPSHQVLVNSSFLLWKPLDTFMKNSFYNLCLPVSP